MEKKKRMKIQLSNKEKANLAENSRKWDARVREKQRKFFDAYGQSFGGGKTSSGLDATSNLFATEVFDWIIQERNSAISAKPLPSSINLSPLQQLSLKLAELRKAQTQRDSDYLDSLEPRKKPSTMDRNYFYRALNSYLKTP